MSKKLDNRYTQAHLEADVGRMTIEMWQKQNLIRVLEARVDELDPPDAPEPEKETEKDNDA